jgi:probable rRNA maturation factor
VTGPVVLEIEVEDDAWTEALPDAETLCEIAVKAALAHVGKRGAINLLLTDDEAQRELNQRFRGKDSSTNVLSFPAPEFPGPGPKMLGDLSLAYGVCEREAREQGKLLGDHLVHLVVHGTLHLVGYDHETEAEAEAMEGLEREVLAGLDIEDPYAPRPGVYQQAAREQDGEP